MNATFFKEFMGIASGLPIVVGRRFMFVNLLHKGMLGTEAFTVCSQTGYTGTVSCRDRLKIAAELNMLAFRSQQHACRGN